MCDRVLYVFRTLLGPILEPLEDLEAGEDKEEEGEEDRRTWHRLRTREKFVPRGEDLPVIREVASMEVE